MAPKIWLITGTSTGFGRAMTELLLKKGEIVIATLRKPEALDDLHYGRDRLLVLKLDVSKPADVKAAFAKAKEVFGRIDVVYNNAGYGVLGEFESGTNTEEVRAMFDTNFWGAADINRAAIEFFREVNGPAVGGKLLVMSSMAAHNAIPALAYYCASKHALEGVTETMARELVPAWNINVTLIVTGSFKTSGAQTITVTPPHPAYTESASMLTRKYVHASPGDDLDKGIHIIYKLSQEPHLPIRFPLGLDAVRVMKDKAAQLKEQAEKYESWSV